jgi:hypothetical protein
VKQVLIGLGALATMIGWPLAGAGFALEIASSFDRFAEWEDEGIALIIVGILIVLVGLVGVHNRLAPDYGPMGTAGTICLTVGLVLLPTFVLTIPGAVLTAAGLSLFGVATFRAAPVAPRAGLAIALALPLGFVVGYGLDFGGLEDADAVGSIAFALALPLPWMWLGLAVLRRPA